MLLTRCKSTQRVLLAIMIATQVGWMSVLGNGLKLPLAGKNERVWSDRGDYELRDERTIRTEACA